MSQRRIYTSHARDRMEERGITEEMVHKTIVSPSKVLKDLKRDRKVYVKDGLFVIVEGTKVVTVWFSSDWVRVIERKIRKGEWAENNL